MKFLSEFEGVDAIELLGDILEPAATIFSSKSLKDTIYAAREAGKPMPLMAIAQIILKEYPREILSILAAMDGVPVDEYKVNAISLPQKLIHLLNDPLLAQFFPSQGQRTDKTSSGSVTETTEANEM